MVSFSGVVITGGVRCKAGVEKSAKVNLKMPVRIGVPKELPVL